MSIVKTGLSIYVSFLSMNIKAKYVAQRFKSRSLVIFRHKTALLQTTKVLRMGDVLLISEYRDYWHCQRGGQLSMENGLNFSEIFLRSYS